MKQPAAGHPLDFIFVLRPVLLVPVWTIYLCGAASDTEHIPAAFTPVTLLVLAALTAVFGAVFVLNQYYDVESDRLNHKGHLLPLDLISGRSSLVLYACLNVAGFALLSSLALWLLLALAATTSVLGYLYSAPPWRLKDRAFPALAANAVAHGVIVFLCGWASARVDTSLDYAAAVLASLPYFFAVGSVYLLTTLPDRPGDEQTGKRTMAVVLGTERTARWSLGWFAAALLLGFYTLDLLFVLAALVALPAVYRARNGSPPRALAAVKWTVGALSVAVCFPFPWYAAMLVGGFFFTRVYYRWRFDLNYP